MSSFSVANICHCGFFTYLVMFSFYVSVSSSVSLDLTELRNKVAKIKVNPRGNLWATGNAMCTLGHFMGKKSVKDTQLFPIKDTAAMNAQVEPTDIYDEMLKIALQTLIDSQDIIPKIRETALLMKILSNYIEGNRK
ncbi:Neuromedin-B Neuromedin-B-32 [Triplophysa tibetana]|uniref:Neuromedin-B Neuromedin-B-32 n=1 Tax=Triplophysa tibetana TaxID=1572043 RepID=A0A5A9PLU9_9TELE|nr:Neuromedin-B Neuromedin-B-32 [Triplophysa tibetana]